MNPTSYQGAATTMQAMIRTISSRDATDVPSDPAATHHRRRIVWPTLNTNLRRLIISPRTPPPPSQDLIRRTAAMLNVDFSKCDINGPVPADDATIVYYHSLF